MLSRLRRFAAALLALALVPAVSGAAQCADHGATGSAQNEIVAGAASGSNEHGSHRRGAENAAHSHHVVIPAAEQQVSPDDSSHVTEDRCCPPSGVPGECGSAMGCSAFSVTPVQRTLAQLHVIERAIIAEGVDQATGPSRAPEVPPPRS